MFNFLQPLKKVPENDFDQDVARYYVHKQKFKPCCFGAHLAKILNCSLFKLDNTTTKYYYYGDGKDEFLKRTGMSEAECTVLFYELGIVNRYPPSSISAGEIRDPFGIFPWLITVKEAIERLEKDGERVLKEIRRIK